MQNHAAEGHRLNGTSLSPMLLLCPACWWRSRRLRTQAGAFVLLAMMGSLSSARDAGRPVSTETPSAKAPGTAVPSNPESQINVNWLYGSYVPKDVPLESLDGKQRFKLYTRQTYTTWGIYIKTTLFALHDQIHDSNPQWGDSWEGFAKRLGTREVQFVAQNSISSLGDGLLGWESRYDRCRCDGFWPRTRHAIARNFVTYASDETSLRPQLMPYVGAFGGGAMTSTWEPGNQKWYVAGYQSAITQVLVGIGVDWLGEFAPDIRRMFHRTRDKTP